MHSREHYVKQAVIEASSKMKQEGIRHVLVGTAGLRWLGYNVEKVNDVDFLVESVPMSATPKEGSSTGSGEATLYGIRVDYINCEDNSSRLGFLNQPFLTIQGVPVATTSTIIELKRWADRDKDRAFLAGWDARELTP